MKNTTYVKPRILTSFSLFLLMAFCCLSTNIANAQSGEDFFRAIYFGEGATASKIPQLEGMSIRNYTSDATDIKNAMRLQDQIVNTVKRNNSKFLGTFQSTMTSGNHVAIRAKLNEGKQVMSAAASSLGIERDLSFERKVAAEVAASMKGSKGTFADVDQAISDYAAQHDAGNSDNPALADKYIYNIAYVWIIVYIEWYFDPEESLAGGHQDKLVNSIANNF